MPPKRQRPEPAATADLASTNSTTNRFLGKSAKSWMTGASHAAVTPQDTIESRPLKKPRLEGPSRSLSKEKSITRDDWSSSSDEEPESVKLNRSITSRGSQLTLGPSAISRNASGSNASSVSRPESAHNDFHSSSIAETGHNTALDFSQHDGPDESVDISMTGKDEQPEHQSRMTNILDTGTAQAAMEQSQRDPGRQETVSSNVSLLQPPSILNGQSNTEHSPALQAEIHTSRLRPSPMRELQSSQSRIAPLPSQVVAAMPRESSIPNAINTPIAAVPASQQIIPSPVQDLSKLHEVLKQQVANTLDKARMAFISRCAYTPDLQGILIHQIFMISTHHPDWLVTSLGFGEVHRSGMGLVNYTFGSNMGLTPAFSAALLDYPEPSQVLLFPKFRPSIDTIKVSLQALSVQWQRTQQKCVDRNFPPSPMEISEIFCLESPELVVSLFVALNMSIQKFHQQWNEQVHAQFREMQRVRQTTPIRIEQEIENWRLTYIQSATTHHPTHGQAPPQSNSRQGRPVLPHSHTSSGLASANENRSGHASRTGVGGSNQIFNDQSARMYQTQSAAAPRNPLLPPNGVLMAQAVHPNADRVALHQAHLRGPVTEIVDLEGNPAPDVRLYAVGVSLSSGPLLLTQAARYSELRFEVDESQTQRRAKSAPMPCPSFPLCKVFLQEGTLQWRLRCIQRSRALTAPSEAEFSAMGTFWPEHLLVIFNGAHIEVRRKVHNGRGLAAYISSEVSAGPNVLAMSHDEATKEIGKESWVAIELVELFEHQKLRNSIKPLTAEAVLQDIVKVMKPVDDEDLAIVSSAISIDITDPFTAVVWKTPVRSKYCTHRECFDLDTFLDTRSKEREGILLYSADEWRCPLCNKDARPMNLVIDGFLESVREALEHQGKLESVKAISVKEDGQWECKEGVEGQRGEAQARASARSTSASMGIEQDYERNQRATATSVNDMEAIVVDEEH